MRKVLSHKLVTAVALVLSAAAYGGCSDDGGGGDPQSIGPPPGLPTAPTVARTEIAPAARSVDPDQRAQIQADSLGMRVDRGSTWSSE